MFLNILDVETAITFIEKLKEKVKSSDEAKILCLTTMGTIRIRTRDLPATKVCVSGPYCIVK